MGKSLPIYEVKEQIVSGLKRCNRMIIQSPTGSGKSTQVPQILVNNNLNGEGKILILQPRRIAARLLSRRVAYETGTKLGDLVGYQIRFEDVSSKNTKIKFVTEGVLLRSLLNNDTLNGVSVVIFDEFHERHLYTDVSLARVLHLQETMRPDLKIIVMSATLELDTLEKFLNPCEVVKSEGKSYPVDMKYCCPPMFANLPLWEKVGRGFLFYLSYYQDGGDVLIFLPGAYEIRKTIETLKEIKEARDYIIFPLYGELPVEAQEAAIRQYDKKKIVVATNIAETSITIDGITAVIDSGLARIPETDPITGISSLKVREISQSSANQRTGRAGRTSPGICIRLWDASEHSKRNAFEIPEILRLELSEIMLLFKASGINKLSEFKWFDAPRDESLFAAERLLKELGALDENGNLTEIGWMMSKFPVHPRYARMLIEAQRRDCVYHTALIASIIQTGNFIYPVSDSEYSKVQKNLFYSRDDSDFFMMIKAFEYALECDFDFEKCRLMGIKGNLAYQVHIAHQQFLSIAKREGFNTAKKNLDKQAIQKCILVGLSDLVGRRVHISNNMAELVRGRRGQIDNYTVVNEPDLFVASEVLDIERYKDYPLIFETITKIKEEWLKEIFPNDIKNTEPIYYYDTQSRSVIQEEVVLYRDLVLRKSQKPAPPSEITAKILAKKVLEGELVLKDWDAVVEKWILRVNLLNKWCPELEIPSIGNEEKLVMLEHICYGASTYKEIKERPVKNTVFSYLNEYQRSLVDKFAPERFKLSNGKTPRIVYVENGQPYISMRIQELYGVQSIPGIAMDRVEVLIHILAPNMQPVQITNDLKGFWERHYPEIKKQYQRLYPKHEWK
ncbi:MAG: ATP-dependent RNA helicase [Verrucomicrobiae bacterium]|nr:ATP-dependent RNA helicase [Verrucomicrobiae bacterium]